MTGDQRHLFVAVKDDSRSSMASRVQDRGNDLLRFCQRYLPDWVSAELISSTRTLEYSVYRHSTAPYWPDFDASDPRILLKLSLPPDAMPETSPLQQAAALAGCALTIADHHPADVLCWPHAQLISEMGQVRAAMERFAHGKDAPVLQFVRMSLSPDSMLTSTGLYYFCGQEIRLRAIGTLSASGLVRRACRIAADGMLNGPYEKPVTVAGLEAGEQIRIRPESLGIWKSRIRWLTVECDLQAGFRSGTDL